MRSLPFSRKFEFLRTDYWRTPVSSSTRTSTWTRAAAESLCLRKRRTMPTDLRLRLLKLVSTNLWDEKQLLFPAGLCWCDWDKLSWDGREGRIVEDSANWVMGCDSWLKVTQEAKMYISGARCFVLVVSNWRSLPTRTFEVDKVSHYRTHWSYLRIFMSVL